MKHINKLQLFLENLDSYRDRALFLFIKPYWPRKITPNHVTYVRLFIAIALIALLFIFGIEDKTLVITLFAIGILTDFIDGPIARGTDQVTEFGAMLDSTSDRLLILPIAIYSLLRFNSLLLLILIAIEFINGLASLYYNSKEVYLESNIFGKIKMVMFCVALIGILSSWLSTLPQFFIIILWLTIPLSFLNILSRVLELRSK